VFETGAGTAADPDRKLALSFEAFMRKYKKGLAVERAAVEALEREGEGKTRGA
jgi:hypothetical protein